jgi:hypothetical protein
MKILIVVVINYELRINKFKLLRLSENIFIELSNYGNFRNQGLSKMNGKKIVKYLLRFNAIQ